MRLASMCKHALLLNAIMGSAMAWAQSSPLIPYNGRLEQGGMPASGPHDFRFALFTAESESASCLVTASQSTDICGLWWAQIGNVEVHGGAFSVLLGQAPHPLTHAVLAQQEVWLAMAVKEHGVGAFTLLKGKQRIAEVPRSAGARDFTVSGTLNVGGKVITLGSLTTTGDILNTANDGQLGASKDFVFLDQGGSSLSLRSGPTPEGGVTPGLADLTVGKIHFGSAVGPVSGLELSDPVYATVTTSSTAYKPSQTVSAPTGFRDHTRSICFLTMVRKELYPGNSSWTVGDCQAQQDAAGWKLYAYAEIGNTGNGVKVSCAMRCMRWDR